MVFNSERRMLMTSKGKKRVYGMKILYFFTSDDDDDDPAAATQQSNNNTETFLRSSPAFVIIVCFDDNIVHYENTPRIYFYCKCSRSTPRVSPEIQGLCGSDLLRNKLTKSII